MRTLVCWLVFGWLSLFCGSVLSEPSLPLRETAKTFVVLPVPEPTQFKMQNNNPLLGALFSGLIPGALTYMHNYQNTKMLSEGTAGHRGMGEVALSSFREALQKEGMAEVPSPEVKLDPADPAAIDYTALAWDADILVQLYFGKFGMYSSAFSTTYEPYAYLYYCLVTKRSKPDCAKTSYASYGYGLKKDYPEDLMYMTKGRWENAEDVKNRMPELMESYRFGIEKMANGIAQDILKFAE